MGSALSKMKVRVGIAGWGNPPAQRQERRADQSHLAFYAAQFACVEINSSFHRPHHGDTYRRWRDETPPHFRFSVKLPRSITHEARLRRAAREVSRFYDDIAHLRPKLRALLVQLPPSLEFNLRTTRAFFKGAPHLRGSAVVLEPRHVSWFSPAADEALRELNITRVAADPPRCPEASRPGGAPRFAYFRWHGSPQMYYSKYSDSQLQSFAAELRQSRAREVWCMFDNTARHAAWDDALRFSRLLDAAQERG